jgi:cobalt/nickel transport system permease protein
MFDNDLTYGKSMIHALDPRVKIIAVAAFSILIAVCSRLSALVPGIFLSILLLLLSSLRLRRVLVRVGLANGFILFLWFFLPFSFDGERAFTIGPLTATEEGLRYAVMITLRSNIILLALICLMSTTSIFTIGRALRQLLVPAKLIQLFFFTFRYLHVMQTEYQRLINAMKIRGFQPRTSMHTYRTYAYLFGMLLVRSYDRSERIRNAMLLRGFRGRFYDLGEFSLKPSDFVIMFFIITVLGGIVLLQWTRIIY